MKILRVNLLNGKKLHFNDNEDFWVFDSKERLFYALKKDRTNWIMRIPYETIVLTIEKKIEMQGEKKQNDASSRNESV